MHTVAMTWLCGKRNDDGIHKIRHNQIFCFAVVQTWDTPRKLKRVKTSVCHIKAPHQNAQHSINETLARIHRQR